MPFETLRGRPLGLLMPLTLGRFMSLWRLYFFPILCRFLPPRSGGFPADALGPHVYEREPPEELR